MTAAAGDLKLSRERQRAVPGARLLLEHVRERVRGGQPGGGMLEVNPSAPMEVVFAPSRDEAHAPTKVAFPVAWKRQCLGRTFARPVRSWQDP